MYHRRPCCWQVSLEHLRLFGSPFFASPPPSSTEVIYRTLVGQHRFQPQGLHLMQHIFGSSLCFTSHCLPVCVGEHHLCTQGRSRRTLGRRGLHGCRLCKAGGGRQADTHRIPKPELELSNLARRPACAEAKGKRKCLQATAPCKPRRRRKTASVLAAGNFSGTGG